MQKQSKQKTVILDSSVWIAYFYPLDIHHFKAVKILDKYQHYKILLPEIVYFETLIKSNKLLGTQHDLIGLIKSLKDQTTIIKLNFLKVENLILKYSNIINLKSSDFQILIYVVTLKPNLFISFDKKLTQEYNKLNLKKLYE